MTQKLTPWFPVSINPVRAGVYAVLTPNYLANKFAYYNEKDWGLCARTALDAAEVKYSCGWACTSMLLPGAQWRGIAK